jgi:hypothetical protein
MRYRYTGHPNEEERWFIDAAINVVETEMFSHPGYHALHEHDRRQLAVRIVCAPRDRREENMRQEARQAVIAVLDTLEKFEIVKGAPPPEKAPRYEY